MLGRIVPRSVARGRIRRKLLEPGLRSRHALGSLHVSIGSHGVIRVREDRLREYRPASGAEARAVEVRRVIMMVVLGIYILDVGLEWR